MEEHLYVVTYDVSDPKRWCQVFKLMNGYGEWLQLSVFQCRMSRKRQAMLVSELYRLIDDETDHVLILDVGPADGIEPRVTSLGKTFKPVEREAIVV